jgi:hypothetical protein
MPMTKIGLFCVDMVWLPNQDARYLGIDEAKKKFAGPFIRIRMEAMLALQTFEVKIKATVKGGRAPCIFDR